MNNVVPAAGARMDKVQGSGLMGGPGSVTDCLTFAARPGTPPEIKKYRRTSALTPGARYQHYGIADDLSKMNLGERVYGGSSAKGAESAGELVNSQLPTEMQRITMEKAEGIYKERAKEPLGRTVDRGIVLPSKFTVGKTPFGCVGKSDTEKAKDVIFPDVSEEQIEGEEIYRRSHGFSYPGEQKNRGYKWYVDPVTTRFGVKGDTIALNGVSKNIADVLKGAGDNPSVINIKKVEDYRNMGDVLGQSKNLGQGSAARPFDTVYGKASASSRKSGNVWGAAQTIQGKYTVDQQLPDFDLGKSITPGFRNISLEVSAPFSSPHHAAPRVDILYSLFPPFLFLPRTAPMAAQASAPTCHAWTLSAALSPTLKTMATTCPHRT